MKRVYLLWLPGSPVPFSAPSRGQGLGITAGRGPDLLSLGATGESTPTPVAGNQPPVVSIAAEEVASCLGTKAMKFTVTASDPDGDMLTWHWQGVDGRDHVDADAVARLYPSGKHEVSVVVSDGREAKRRRCIRLPCLQFPNMIAVLVLISTARSSVRVNMDLPMASSPIPVRPLGRFLGPIGSPLTRVKTPCPWARSRKLGTTKCLRYVILMAVLCSYLPKVLILVGLEPTKLPPRSSADDRFMITGTQMKAENPGLKLSGIPYATYDVVMYLGGNPTLPVPEQNLWETVGIPVTVSKKDKKAKARKEGDLVITLNGQKKTFATAKDTHNRWPGYYSLLDDANPQGNVIIWKGVTGKTLSFHAQGSAIAGIQILEAK